MAGPADALASGKVHAHIIKSKFKPPGAASTPIIMVGAGTGLAPFRAFIAERAKIKTMGKPVGPMILFFGCRRPEEDFIYREELEKYRETLGGDIFHIVTAFSRVEAQQKMYVQDRVEEYGVEVVRMIDNGASFYVCGRASMAREVGQRVSDAVRKVKGLRDAEVNEWRDGMKRKGKWKEDVWE